MSDDMPYATTEPVVLTHLADDAHPHLVACSPQLLPDYSVVRTGRFLLCPLCLHYARGGCSAPAVSPSAVDLPSAP